MPSLSPQLVRSEIPGSPWSGQIFPPQVALLCMSVTLDHCVDAGAISILEVTQLLWASKPPLEMEAGKSSPSLRQSVDKMGPCRFFSPAQRSRTLLMANASNESLLRDAKSRGSDAAGRHKLHVLGEATPFRTSVSASAK